MSLTAALWVVGGLVLLALALHSLWSIRRAAPRRADKAPDAAGGRVEPALGGDAAVVASPADPDGEFPIDRDEAPAASDGDAGAPVAGVLRSASARRVARIDALIDAIAPLAVEAPVSGDLALAHLPASLRAGNKPMHFEGLDSETGNWEPPAAGRRYSEFQAGVQLANRSGALNEIEYSEFVHKAQAFAEGVGAMADYPDMIEVAARARELDAFAGPLDAQLVAVLRSTSVAWSVGYVQQCAARHGFVPGLLPGRLVLPAGEGGGPPMLVLAYDAQAALADDPQTSSVRDVTLSLDVPQTPEAAEPYPAWQRIAQALAQDMGAAVVDDSGRPITIQAFDAIAHEIGQLYRSLESHDLAAGTAAARRLFS